jgi:hypothetical protein
MAKILASLGAVLAAACCAGAAPALAQPHGGVGAAPAPHVSAPAPHIAAPAVPHVSAPAVPHVSAPVPHVAATPHFNAGARINAAPHVATPHFSARTPNVHQFTPHGHAFTARGLARQTVHGPMTTRHARSPGRERALARANARGRETGRLANRRNGIIEPNARTHVAEPNARNRPSRAQLAAVSRPLGERNRNEGDRHRWFNERRRFHRGGFVGWIGPVFWPTAYDDFFDYAFWPYEYDGYGFWAYAYDDLFDNVFFTPGTEDVYASTGGGYASGGRARERRRTREALRGSSEICRVDPSLTQWPVDEIAQVVEPTPQQRDLLNGLKAASARAARLLQGACPAHPPATPLGRLDAMAKRLDTMLQALDVVRPALAKFYDPLSDEQKARFNAMGREQGGETQANNEARPCGTQAPAGLNAEAIDRIERDVRPNDRQRADLDALRDASAKAADALRNACPSQTPITPVARLDAMENHIKAMRGAIDTMRPVLARFYDSLSDEQKAHFNVMGRQAGNQ